MAKGKVVETLGDITDTIHYPRTYKPKKITKTAVYLMFLRVMDGYIPPRMSTYFTSSFLFGLRKDNVDKTKLRPIAVGESLPRSFISCPVKYNVNLLHEIADYH